MPALSSLTEVKLCTEGRAQYGTLVYKATAPRLILLSLKDLEISIVGENIYVATSQPHCENEKYNYIRSK